MPTFQYFLQFEMEKVGAFKKSVDTTRSKQAWLFSDHWSYLLVSVEMKVKYPNILLTVDIFWALGPEHISGGPLNILGGPYIFHWYLRDLSREKGFQHLAKGSSPPLLWVKALLLGCRYARVNNSLQAGKMQWLLSSMAMSMLLSEKGSNPHHWNQTV